MALNYREQLSQGTNIKGITRSTGIQNNMVMYQQRYTIDSEQVAIAVRQISAASVGHVSRVCEEARSQLLTLRPVSFLSRIEKENTQQYLQTEQPLPGSTTGVVVLCCLASECIN